MERKNVWKEYTDKQTKDAMKFAEDYKFFLDHAKTEREAVDQIVNTLEDAGFVELEKAIESGKKLKAGDKVYAVQMNKTLAAFIIGKKPLTEGMNILGAHIDSPRLDIKQNPLYEDTDFAYLDTHYYGGVKKYQWVTIPLALHGVVVKKDGTTVELNVGEDEDDPVFFISDLLIHLAAEQMDKKASKVIEGEALDVIIGSKPLTIKKTAAKDKGEADGKDAVKKAILQILKDTYDFEEEDFLSAEIEVVPAGKCRDAGFDRSMILGYGHDDRVCAYPSVRALMEVKTPERTTCAILADKEEIGSDGATGMQSMFFENVVAELAALTGFDGNLYVRRIMKNSFMLSSDVSAAYDPTYAGQFDKKNSAYFGGGMVYNKYTGSRGKYGSSDANAEYVAQIRAMMDADKVVFQTAELGKVDAGGGGTIALYLAKYGMNVIDSGVAVLNMHAPWECISKVDLYETFRGYVSFLKRAGK